MILSLVDLLFFVAFIPFGFWVRFRVADTINSRLIFQYCQAAAFAALCLAIGNLTASVGNFGVALFFCRLSFALYLGTAFMVLLLSFSFPYERQNTVIRTLFMLVWAVLSWGILFTPRFLTSVAFNNGETLRTPGPNHYVFILILLGALVLSILILGMRRFMFKSMIYRLQALVVVGSGLIGVAAFYLFFLVLPERLLISWTYNLVPIATAVIAGGFSYSITITRLFNLKDVFSSSFSFVLYTVVLGVVAGLGVLVVAWPLYRDYPVLAFILFIAVYLFASAVGMFLRNRFEYLLRNKNAYGESLEVGLADLDFSLGRDQTIATFLGLLRDKIGCNSVNLFVEGQSGEMVDVSSKSDSPDGFNIHVPGVDLLLNNDVSIVLKTEIVTNYEYHEVKESLLQILDRFDGDALILLREGRAVIGSIILGAKRTGGDFTDYDYDTLTKLYGKFFVVAYYLKNVAQESLVMTVDRELEFSEQIIQSIQENIDRIEHPAVDISYLTRSTRKLGGDFIDFIRLTPNRFIFVLGDVSGKGLNASMSMVILKSVIRTFLKETKDFKKLVIKTNAFIKANLPKGTFFAGVFGLFDFKERALYYVNCGVPAMFLLSSSYNNPVEIQGDGKVLGFVKDITPYVTVRKASFKPDDILLTTTDGLTDAESLRGVRFGKERIQSSLMENRAQPAERIVRYLSESAEEFVSQELSDDITILAVKFLQNKE